MIEARFVDISCCNVGRSVITSATMSTSSAYERSLRTDDASHSFHDDAAVCPTSNCETPAPARSAEETQQRPLAACKRCLQAVFFPSTSACTTSPYIWVKPAETILHIRRGGVALLPCAARDGHVGSVSSGIWRAIHRAGYGNFSGSPALRSRVFARHCLRSRSSPTSGLRPLASAATTAAGLAILGSELHLLQRQPRPRQEQALLQLTLRGWAGPPLHLGRLALFATPRMCPLRSAYAPGAI